MTDPERDDVQRSLGRLEGDLKGLLREVRAQRAEANEGRAKMCSRIDELRDEWKTRHSAHDIRITTLEHDKTQRKGRMAVLIAGASLLSALFVASWRHLLDWTLGGR